MFVRRLPKINMRNLKLEQKIKYKKEKSMETYKKIEAGCTIVLTGSVFVGSICMIRMMLFSA